MAGSGVSTGGDTRAAYYWEDNGFAQSPNDSTAKVPGADFRVQTSEGRNELERIFTPGTSVAIDQLALVFEGAFTLEFTLTDPWWLRMVFGTPSTVDNGDDSYTHTYQTPSPDSFQLVQGHEQTGKERRLKGCVVQRVDVDTASEETADVTLEGAYADEEINDPADIISQPEPSNDALSFADASVGVGGTTETHARDVSTSWEFNVQMIRALSSRFPIDFAQQTLEPSVDLAQFFDGDHESLEELFGGTGNTTPQEDVDNDADVALTIDNGDAAGSGINKGVFTILSSLSESYDPEGMANPREILVERISRQARDVKVEWTNETQTPP